MLLRLFFLKMLLLDYGVVVNVVALVVVAVVVVVVDVVAVVVVCL